MRLAAIEISNYKGLSQFSLGDLSDSPAIILTGKNGTGKSLVLEAIVFAWAARYSDRDRVGPWGDKMMIEMAVKLTSAELEKVSEWHLRAGHPAPDPDDLTHSLQRTVHRINEQTENLQGPVMQTLRDVVFQRENQFAVIDFLPSTRSIPLNADSAVDLGIFSPARQNQERESYLDGYMKGRSPVLAQRLLADSQRRAATSLSTIIQFDLE